MTGRVIIVTGGNSGIGYEVSKYLAEGGNDVVMACRDKEKGDAAVNKIKSVHPSALIQCLQLDLSSLSSIREFVKEFSRLKRKLNVLINNAGVLRSTSDMSPRMTGDGFELTMATNHLGPFLLTNLLSEYLVQTAETSGGECRIVNVSCSAHDHTSSPTTRNLQNLDMQNFQLEQADTYSALQAYKNSKLCSVLTTYQLAESLRMKHVTVNAVDPGYVPTTELYRLSSKVKHTFDVAFFHYMLRTVHVTQTRSARQAAVQIGNLAISDKYTGMTGRFFRNGEVDRSSLESYDRDLQREVWSTSCRLVNCHSDNGEETDDVKMTV